MRFMNGVSLLYKKIFLLVSLSFVLLVSGCVSIDVDQKLKRNGNYDISLSFSTATGYEMILKGLKEGIHVDESVKDKFEFKETDSSIIYSFINVDPRIDKKLFKKVENATEDSEDLDMIQDMNVDLSFLDPENVELNRELNFPYYEYTYTFKMIPESTESEEDGVLSKSECIIDEANILDEQSETEIMDRINFIYENDSVQLVVITKDQIDEYEYYSYTEDFVSNNGLDSKDYILIFVSTGENGMCVVESNIYLDSEVSSKVSDLNDVFKQNCNQESGLTIVSIVTNLDNFFKEHDLESINQQVQEEIGDMFSIDYTVEVFGKVESTTGTKLEESIVKFDVSTTEEGEYTVVFKDFFLASILGDSYLVYLLIFGVILVGGIGFVFVSKVMKKKKSQPPVVPLAINPQLVDYVRRARSSGMSDQQIRERLLIAGWIVKDVDAALKLR